MSSENDELTNLINEYPDVHPETINRIFIRNTAREAYLNGNLQSQSSDIASQIHNAMTIGEMKTDDDIRDHIANLEKARAWLSCHIQGIRQGQEKKLAPVFKAKHEAEETVKKIKRQTKDAGVQALVAALLAGNAKSPTGDSANSEPKLSKIECNKCHQMVFSLKFHKC